MSFTVSKEFIKAFEFCMKYYGVTDEELEYEKSRVRNYYEEANSCYLSIYRGLNVNHNNNRSDFIRCSSRFSNLLGNAFLGMKWKQENTAQITRLNLSID